MRVRRSTLGRITLLGVSAALVAVLGLGLSGDGPLTEDQSAEAQTASRPNIIFILSDDQAESTLAYMPYVQNLIKAKGRTFDNAFNAYPKPPGWDVFGIPTVPAKVGETNSATFANRAMAQLREDAPKADPFYLQVGFHAPHAPNEYESKYAGMFVGERVPRVPSFD